MIIIVSDVIIVAIIFSSRLFFRRIIFSRRRDNDCRQAFLEYTRETLRDLERCPASWIECYSDESSPEGTFPRKWVVFQRNYLHRSVVITIPHSWPETQTHLLTHRRRCFLRRRNIARCCPRIDISRETTDAILYASNDSQWFREKGFTATTDSRISEL